MLLFGGPAARPLAVLVALAAIAVLAMLVRSLASRASRYMIARFFADPESTVIYVLLGTFSVKLLLGWFWGVGKSTVIYVCLGTFCENYSPSWAPGSVGLPEASRERPAGSQEASGALRDRFWEAFWLIG